MVRKITISEKDFEKAKNTAFSEGYLSGEKQGYHRAIFEKCSINNIRSVLGLSPIKDGFPANIKIVDEMHEPPKEKFLYKSIDILQNNDVVNRPAHYTDGKIEVIDFIEDKKLGFCLGNAVKYIARAGKKDPTKEVEDLKKAEWYINRRIKEIEEGIV